MKIRRRLSASLWAIVIGGTGLSGCALTTASPAVDPGRVLHIEDQVSQAIMISVNGPASDTDGYTTGIRPCGGEITLTYGKEIPAVDNWQVFLVMDPSGSFDAKLADWSDDPHDMPETFPGSIVWSRGDIPSSSLPQWISVTSTGTILSSTPPPAPLGSGCLPGAFSTAAPNTPEPSAPSTDAPGATP